MKRALSSVRALAMLALLCGVSWGNLHVPHAIAERAASQQLAEIQRAIDQLDLLNAEQRIAALSDDPALAPAALYYRGLLHFHHGDYVSAQASIDAALDGAPSAERPASWVQMQTMVAATRRLIDRMQTQQSGDGRYRVYYESEDAPIAGYALRVLEAADRVLTERLHTRVPGPLRLEIYPSPASLAEVSPLTVTQIETSGTIALCKWNRLMVTTPRALVRGYPWGDTIAHELTHLFVSSKTTERAPVWLQEGIAKMLERAWRARADGAFGFAPDEHAFRMDSATEALLLDAAKQDKLLPFQRLHPSIAMLPSQEQAALAFAQVSTFMHRFANAHGDAGLREALDHVAQGLDATEALARVAGAPFASLERQWSTALRAQSSKPATARTLAMRFVHGKGKPDETSEVAQEAARRFMRLGDMLWSRGRGHAASIEYGKAHQVDPNDPIVASRYGRSALSAGDAATARTAMTHLLSNYPEHAPALSVLGSAALALGDHAAAQRAAYAAILINPFDPEPHCVLAKTLSGADRDAEAQRCATLR